MLRRICIASGVFIVLLIFFQGVAQATPQQLTNAPGNQGRPDVSGNTVVWKDNRNGNWDIYMFDLATMTESPVSVDPAYQNVPVTNGLIVVWQDNRSGDNDIYMKNLLTGITEPLVSGPGNQMLPAISGNKVVYVDNQVASNPADTDPNNHIYMIDLQTREIQTICTAPGGQWQPRISGDRVVWQDQRNGKWDIYMKDLTTGVESPVCTDPGSHAVADIDGTRIVWQDYRNSWYDIWIKDISTGVSTPITNDAAYQNSPRISGDLVVWENYDYNNTANDYDIDAMDLTSGRQWALATGPSTQARPAVDKERVVWEQTGTNGYDIWTDVVPDTTPPTISSVTPADGTATGCSAPPISAALSDNRAGVDPASVQLELDGQNVSAEANITADSISYQQPLGDGLHNVTLSVSDMAGNRSTASWSFTASSPSLQLAGQRAFWGSLDDYNTHQLSIEYTVSNQSAANADNVQITDSSATAGVIFVTPLPAQIGNIAAGGQGSIVAKYMIPTGISRFRTSVYSSWADECGTIYYAPGPSPGT